MRRTLLIAALAAVALLGLVACGDEADDGAATTPPAPATTPAATPEETPTQAGGDAAALYADNCSGCHDADGSGDTGPDLRDEDDVDGIAAQVREGGGGMPSFAGELTDDQIEALASYVASEL